MYLTLKTDSSYAEKRCLRDCCKDYDETDNKPERRRIVIKC